MLSVAITKEFYDNLDRLLKSAKPFSLDTDKLIDLAKEGKFSVLATLSNSKNYVLTTTVASELIGLCYGKILKDKEVQQIKSFLSLCKTKGRLVIVNTKEIETKLAPLAYLLPRKIVFDVVIGDDQSFVKGLILQYDEWEQSMRESKRITINYSTILQEFDSEKEQLLAKCITKLDNHLFINHISFDEKMKERFEAEITGLLNAIVKILWGIINKVLKENRMMKETLNNLKSRLNTYSTEEYKKTMAAINQAISNGARFSNFDSDVVFLMRLYSRVA